MAKIELLLCVSPQDSDKVRMFPGLIYIGQIKESAFGVQLKATATIVSIESTRLVHFRKSGSLKRGSLKSIEKKSEGIFQCCNGLEANSLKKIITAYFDLNNEFQKEITSKLKGISIQIL